MPARATRACNKLRDANIEPPVRGRASGVKNLYLEEDAVVLEYGLGQECAKLVGVFGREGRVSVL